MNVKAEAKESRFDLLKWLAVAALVVVGVVGNQYFSAEPILYRVMALLVIAAVAGVIALQTSKGKPFGCWQKKLALRFARSFGQLARKPRRQL